ncbi:hypothetical protein FB192DRAFT_1447148 [Mucor lusitanicus]|uniref:Integrase zinc-binding domain-containing protein n=1 Tax=Mucor circinelloides f. lusitanicus TaxID=29924 RepID=A0A8H4BJ41_MUCCL|nr:hypothetical protein FB192DRAFT_1447148 [Mucor lusitanicus]
MDKDVEQWVKHCEACQRRKVRTESTAPELKPITPAYLHKWAVTAALPSFDTDHIVPVLLYEVVLKFGVPARLITDNGFNNSIFLKQ